ncbi:beta-carotene hydroxylase [Aquimarina sp. MMG015]|uniref:beta-carotene hydroxylase n=1 Tax=Aquimarina TaxID=290174 RepID=UPI0004879D44|nr:MULTISPECIES: beta-carotene hydroxylase [Aquimarina]MBQ4803888.1 beta-carotene hydroxylase [Aquimarina sp. MMG015]
MNTLIWISIFIATFCFMEFMAWFTHKYVMHGFLWSLHKDHHHKDHSSWWERNDLFFVFYAVISMSCIMLHDPITFWFGESIGFGILAYGIAYFLVHDIFIHQRFKLFRNANHWYAKGVRRAHKIHHKHLGKNKGECFGMLFVPFKYFKK